MFLLDPLGCEAKVCQLDVALFVVIIELLDQDVGRLQVTMDYILSLVQVIKRKEQRLQDVHCCLDLHSSLSLFREKFIEVTIRNILHDNIKFSACLQE